MYALPREVIKLLLGGGNVDSGGLDKSITFDSTKRQDTTNIEHLHTYQEMNKPS